MFTIWPDCNTLQGAPLYTGSNVRNKGGWEEVAQVLKHTQRGQRELDGSTGEANCTLYEQGTVLRFLCQEQNTQTADRFF